MNEFSSGLPEKIRKALPKIAKELHSQVTVSSMGLYGSWSRGDAVPASDLDILVVDRSIRARHGHVVVAFINGERLVKRLHRRGGRVALVAENPGYPALEIQDGMELEVWGVVVGKFKRFAA